MSYQYKAGTFKLIKICVTSLENTECTLRIRVRTTPQSKVKKTRESVFQHLLVKVTQKVKVIQGSRS